MKKKLMIIGLIGTLPFLTACGSSSGSKMTCSEKISDGFEMKYTYEFDGDDVVTGMALEEIIDFSKVEDLSEWGCGDSIEECMKEAKSEYDECKNDTYYKDCEITKETKDSVTIKAYFSDKGMEAAKDDLGVEKITKEIIEKNVKDRGLTCE